jgi:hypothetical protein
MAQLFSQALASLLVASYGSQGYGGTILSRLKAGKIIDSGRVLLYLPRNGPKRRYLLYQYILPWKCMQRTLLRNGHFPKVIHVGVSHIEYTDICRIPSSRI